MKKIMVLLLSLIMIFTFVACTPKPPANDDDNIVGEDPIEEPMDNKEDPEDEIVDPTPKTDSREVKLYFANNEYVETGDESLEKLIQETRTIEFGDISLEEAVVRELMKGPESPDLSVQIPATAKLIGVELADGTAFVNFASEGLYGGSLQETFTINEIVASLLDLDSVERVQFLIDGKKADSLMGHYEILEPFDKVTE